MADTDEDLQEEVNNAVAGGKTDDTAENANGDTSDGEAQEGDDTSESSEEVETSATGAGDSTSSSEAEDDEEDDDEDDTLVPFQPGQPGKVPENFDIRTLPRDSQGLIDPEAANKAIQEWADGRANAQLTGAKTEMQAREVLTSQWGKAKEKYPHLFAVKDLAVLSRDIHLNSIAAAQNGTGRYMSPLASAKKVNKLYARAVKSGVTQQKTRSTVERTTTTERTSGKGGSAVKSEYAQASEQALSKDPRVAQEGRRKVMAIRYSARNPKS